MLLSQKPIQPPLCTGAHYYWILNHTADTSDTAGDLPFRCQKLGGNGSSFIQVALLLALMVGWANDTTLVGSITSIPQH